MKIVPGPHRDIQDLILDLLYIHPGMSQKEISEERGREVRIPVYYFTELMGLAMGHPDVTKWLKRHIVDPIGLLSSKGLV